jgi:hypothetical protein
MLARVFVSPRRLLGPARAFALATLLAVSLGGMSSAAYGITSVEGGNSFNELSQKAQEQEPTKSTETTTTTATNKKQGTSRTTIFIGIGAAIVLLLAIASVIIRDAHKLAPADDPADVDARVSRELVLQQRKRRAKAKAARHQRKRNR